MKKMYAMLLMLGLLFTPFAQGQVTQDKKHHEKRAQIQAQKIAFLTTRMELTPDEAEKFWPIFNKYDLKRQALREEGRKARAGKKISEMSEAEMTALVDRKVAMEIEMAQLEKEFIDEVKGVVPIKKILLMQRAEREFKRQMVKKMRQKRN